MSDDQTLKKMIQEAPDQSAALQSNIDAMDDQIDTVTGERDAIQNSVCGVAETEAIVIINALLLVWLITEPTAFIIYGPGFGSIAWSDPGPVGNISNWGIYKPVPLLPPIPLYVYTPGVNPILDVLVDDYAFGNDYITRPLTTGASYGMSPLISIYNNGKDLLEENKDKIDESVDVFSRYV